MATGHDSEEVLLGLSESLDSTNHTSTAGIYGALDKLQSTMDCVSAGINKIGDAFAALAAASRETPKAEKRKFQETDEGNDDESNDNDYDDEDDVKSLLNVSSSDKDGNASKKEDDPGSSVLDDIELSIDDDDDVGDEVSDKLAAITNKAFS